MSGNILADVGYDVIVYTEKNADVIYFFDTNNKAWTALQFDNDQEFEEVMADGQTAFAYSEDYIVGYSSMLSQWDKLEYQGNVIDPTGVSTEKGYGCAGKLAYFVTDANHFYVFDAELGQWQDYDFGMVTNASGYNDFWAADTYAGAILERNGYDFAKNIAYSLVTHSFAEEDQGGWYYYPDNKMTGGYVASWGDGEDELRYIGYSANTNEFKSITFPAGYDVYNYAAAIDNYFMYDLLDEINVFTCGYEVGDQFYREGTVKSYCTSTGNWDSMNYDYNPTEMSGLGGKSGGNFSILRYTIDDQDQTIGLWKFYGNTGTHIGEMPDLFKTAVFSCGGKVALGAGDHNLWFHNFETAHTRHKYYAPDDNVYWAKYFAAENYGVVFRVDNSSEVMKVHIFNGSNNNLHIFDANKYPSSNEIATKQVYGYVSGGPQNEVIFYSEILDSVIVYHAAEGYGALTANNFLMVHNSFSEPAVIFDASTAEVFEKDIQISSSSISDSLIFVQDGDSKLTVYNAINKTWEDYETGQQLNGYHVGSEIAMGYSVSFEKYWGYSAKLDSFYPLEPEGTSMAPWSMAGGNTGVVIRSDRLYAFCPTQATGYDEYTDKQNNSITVWQNSPNPFIEQTTISYQLEEAEYIELSVFDSFGKKINTLVSCQQQAGRHRVVFDGHDLAGGVYYYSLSAGNNYQVRKMIHMP
ncbi:MAG: T9SS type A sorting domain-containing protein [bacterium]